MCEVKLPKELSTEGLESGEILAQRPLGVAGRPEGQNLGALVALCGSLLL